VGPEGTGAVTLSSIVAERVDTVAAPGPLPRARRRAPLAWLGAAPFFVYASLFLLLPAGDVLLGAFRSEQGDWTTANVRQLFHAEYLHAFENSIRISIYSAVVGGLIGALICYAALHPGAPRWVRTVFTAFAAVASQFGGVPLAFFFISSIGTLGVVTQFLKDWMGIDIYAHGVTVFGFWGVFLAYVYFQIPLMLLVLAPAVDGLRAEWREASESLGADALTYWRSVGIPVLAPSFLGAMVLLFGNAFAAQATAYALTSGGYNIVPLEITNVLNGNVVSDPHFGQALALGMIVVIAIAVLIYLPLQRRAARWMT
jgi:putative spermidine/putrescine transport system permease protein